MFQRINKVLEIQRNHGNSNSEGKQKTVRVYELAGFRILGVD